MFKFSDRIKLLCLNNEFFLPSLVGLPHSELHFSPSYVSPSHWEDCGSTKFKTFVLRWVRHLLFSFYTCGSTTFNLLFLKWVLHCSILILHITVKILLRLSKCTLLRFLTKHSFSIQIVSSYFLDFRGSATRWIPLSSLTCEFGTLWEMWI